MSTPTEADKLHPLKPLKGACLMFYNVENLYDTQDEPKTHDEEFTASSPKQWDQTKYHFKLQNLGKVFSQIHEQLPAFIGLAEVENQNVLEDLFSQDWAQEKKYEIVHIESQDERGMDVAFVFDPSFFKKEGEEALFVDVSTPQDQDFTRDILHIYGKVHPAQEAHFYINHWPSRREGKEESEFKRIRAAQVLRQSVDNVLDKNPQAFIFILGDFNDSPVNKSIKEVLQTSSDLENALPLTYFNLLERYYYQHKGTLVHQGTWNLFDQIIINSPVLEKGLLHVHSGKIFNKKWLLYRNRRSGFAPNKTYSGDRYHQGYSDHLPVYCIFE